MKKPYESPAWISAAMDDAGLTASEFRVLAHVCRRAGDGANGRGCDSSIATMAKACRVHPDRLSQTLKRLVDIQWLTVEERAGRTWVYYPQIPEVHPPANNGGAEIHPTPECRPHPPTNKGVDPPTNKGDEGKPEGNPLREPKRESAPARPSLNQVIDFAEASAATIPRECAEKFWRENEAVGWMRRGQPVLRWQPLLEAYAAAWARFEGVRSQRDGKLPKMSLEAADALLGGRSPSRQAKAAGEYPEPKVKLPRL